MAEPIEHRLGDAVRPPLRAGPGQRCQRRDARLLQAAHLPAADVGDPAQVVGPGKDLFSGLFPAAPAAVEPRLRRTVERPVPLELEKGAPEPAVIIEVAVGRERPLLALAEDEHHLAGPVAAQLLEEVGVGAELQQEAGLGRAGELGVPRGVVIPAAGAAVAGAAVEEVGKPTPTVGDEVGLVDDGGPPSMAVRVRRGPSGSARSNSTIVGCCSRTRSRYRRSCSSPMRAASSASGSPSSGVTHSSSAESAPPARARSAWARSHQAAKSPSRYATRSRGENRKVPSGRGIIGVWWFPEVVEGVAESVAVYGRAQVWGRGVTAGQTGGARALSSRGATATRDLLFEARGRVSRSLATLGMTTLVTAECDHQARDANEVRDPEGEHPAHTATEAEHDPREV